jgi:diguanylate cyclase (GGDEF)-like protein
MNAERTLISPDVSAEAKLRRHEAARNAFALKMAALHDLSLELSLSEDVDDLCRRAVTMGHRILGYDRISVWFVDPLDPGLLFGTYGTDESGKLRDERGVCYRRSAEALPPDFYEGKDPVYYMGVSPCFDERHNVVGSAERALALIWDGRKVIGEIVVDNLITQRTIDGGSLELLVRFARIVGYLTSLKRVQAELKVLASTDVLTGVVNRRTALVVLEKQFGLSIRNGECLGVAYFDLDGLKDVNDRLGHSVGDEYIKIACSTLIRALRGTDTIGRLGGDEFLVILPDCDAPGVEVIAKRIDAFVAEENSGGRDFKLSLSHGLATSDELETAGLPVTSQSLLELADGRMYEHKRSRRAGRA